MIRFEENPNWLPAQEAKLEASLEAAASEAVEFLKNELSAHSTSGNDWRDIFPDMNYISSDPERKEYPQFQTGQLQEDTSYQNLDEPLSVGIGFFGGDIDKYINLEFGRIQTFASAGSAERQPVTPKDYGPLYMTFRGRSSSEVLSLMRKAMQTEMRSH